MKLILGSGVVGLAARLILGDEWTVIPFGRSRFYSFKPPLDDNWVSHDGRLDQFMIDLGLPITPVWMSRAYSLGGELMREDKNGELALAWLSKVFGNDYPEHAPAYLATRTGFFVYDQVRANAIYLALQAKYQQELVAEAAKGALTEVGDHYIVSGGVRKDFDKCVSTIPLNVLLRLMGQSGRVRHKPSYCIHMITPDLDFEGCTQVMVVDRMFSFYKSTILSKNRYLFHCHEDIPNPGSYFMPILRDFDLVDGAVIHDAIPIGPMPDLSDLEAHDVFSVGAYAQHDFCSDLGSNFLRLIKYADRGQSPSRIIKVGR